MSNKIYYIMGKSAAGKDTIYERLMGEEALNIRKLVLYTTRPMRVGEEDGKEYFFVDEKKKEAMSRDGLIIEERNYHTVHGIWSYFTADDGQVDLSASSYLGIGTLESYEKIRAYYGDDKVCPIYIESDDGERLTRSIRREQKQADPHYEEMCRRFLADQQDFSEENLKRAGITRRFINKDLETCLEEVRGVLAAE